MQANDRFRRDILDRLGTSGPLLSRDIPDTSVVPWPSSGWTNDRNVTQMLEFLTMRGEVAITARASGGSACGTSPSGCTRPTRPSSRPTRRLRIRDERRLRSLGIARATGTAVPVELEHRGRGRRAGDGRGRPRHVARRPRAARPAVRGPHRPAVAVRPPVLRPHPGPASCSTSSTSSRCTSRRPSGAGATSRCRSSTTTGSSGSWTPRPTARPRRSSCAPSTRTCRSPAR